MADTKISDLTELAAEPANDDELVVVDTSAAETKRTLWSTIKAIFALASHAHDAADVTYTPTVLADWDSSADPGDADNAFDQLAERVTDLEGASGHAAVTLGASVTDVLSLATQEIGAVDGGANKLVGWDDSAGKLTQKTPADWGVPSGSDYVAKSLFDANTILAATSDNTPVALTVGEQTLVGRATAGEIDDLSVAQVKTLLGVGAASGIASLNASSKVVEDPANATATATAGKIPIADGSGKIDTWVSDASTSVAGKVEIAVTSEVDSGTETAKAVSPYALANSDLGVKTVELIIADANTTPSATGDGKAHFLVPESMDTWVLLGVAAVVTTVSSSGTPTFAVRRERSGSAVDMLSVDITIDVNEKTSYSATTAPVINTSNDDIATGDIIYVDLNVVGTGAKGHAVALSFRMLGAV